MKWLAHIHRSVQRMSSAAVNRLTVNTPMNNVVQILEGPSVACHAKNAAAALISGHVIALPTDTLYGIAALAQNNLAVENIYKIKRRNSTKPLAICVAEVPDVYHWGKVTIPHSLLNSLLPGPVTLVFQRTPQLNPALNPGTDLVGIRIPDEEFIRTVVKYCGSPIALTSANISTKESPLCVEEFSELWGKLHSVYDTGRIGEQTDCREGSTIIDLSQTGSYRLIRREEAMFAHRIKREKREAAICVSLVTRLKEAVQSVLQPGGTTRDYGPRYSSQACHGPVLGHSDNTNALCNVLEAIFIHGLRDSFSEKMSVLLGADPDRMPVPNFWPVVLIISHRDLIEQIGELSFISSEVGRSRAWVRLALNHGQICSYLSVLLQDSHTLKDYYKPTALLRDSERADIMLGVLQPLSSLTFNLATNAAVLNTWTQTPLVLAGLWTPSIQGMVSDPVLAATDVASTVYDDQAPGVDIPIASTPISDQMFDMIMGGTPETSFISDYMQKNEIARGLQKDMEPDKAKQMLQEDKSKEVCSNKESEEKTNGSKQRSEQSSQKRRESAPPDNQTDQLEVSVTSIDNSRVFLREWSVDSMSRSTIEAAPEYNRLFSDLEGLGGFPSVPGLVVPDLDLSPSASTPSEVSNESSQSDVAEKLSYEVLPLKQPSAEDMRRLLPLLTRLTTEEGLDAQLYKCYQCKSYIGMIYGKPRVCSYDSKYYCYECHENDSALIPARLVHNWDFTLYPVCSVNLQWLSAISHQPLINLRTVNPELYRHIEDLAELQMLRTQLLYVRAYLFTCRSDAGQKLRKLVWPREHLYEHVHLYSVFDLQLVASGQLVPKVRQAVTFGRDHISHCEVCSARGFHCELCSDNEVIYPFQMGNTYTCGVCYGVYHSTCTRGWKECPRCLRRAARREEQQDQEGID